MLSNVHSNRQVNVKRKSRSRPIEINIPICIDDYNHNMGFIDRNYQVLYYYTLNRKTIRWHKKLAMHLIQVRVLDTLGIYNFMKKKESNLFRFFLFYHKKNSLLIVNYQTPKNLMPRLSGRHFIEFITLEKSPNATNDAEFVIYMK